MKAPSSSGLLKPFRRLGMVLADAGYSSRKNLQYIVDKLGAPFIKFKKGAAPSKKPPFSRVAIGSADLLTV